jgi:hypothetical protein
MVTALLILSFILMVFFIRMLSSGYPAYAFFAPLSSGVSAFILARSILRHKSTAPLPWKGREFIRSTTKMSQN